MEHFLYFPPPTLQHRIFSLLQIGDTYSNYDEGTSSTITGTYPTLVIQAGTSSAGLLGASEKGATIEISEISFTKYVEEGEEYENLTFGSEQDSDDGATPGVVTNADGKMHYWNDQGWCGSYIEVDEARYYTNLDEYVLTYRCTSGTAPSYAFQLFLHPGTELAGTWGLTVGDYAEVSLTITSTVTGSVTICDTEVVLTAGVPYTLNEAEVITNYSTSSALFSFQAGYTTYLGDATITISGLTFEHYDLPTQHTNEYKVTWTATTLATQQNEEYAYTNPGYFVRWAAEDGWSCGTAVTVTGEPSLTNNCLPDSGYSANISTSEGAYWYGYQLFYNIPADSDITTGATYYVGANITVNKDAYVTICGVPTQLVSGENEIFIQSGHVPGATSSNGYMADFEFQAGVEGTGFVSDYSLELSITSLTFYWD